MVTNALPHGPSPGESLPTGRDLDGIRDAGAGAGEGASDTDPTLAETSEDAQTAPEPASRPAAPLRPRPARWSTGGSRAVPQSRPHPLPAVDPMLPLAGVQMAVAVCGALSGVALLVAGRPAGWWPLTLAAIAGLGGWLASTLAAKSHPRPRRADWALFASQLLALGWGLALVGPRSSLLVVAVALVLAALRLCGRGDAMAVAVFAAALYLATAVLTLAAIIRPALAFDASSGAVFDGVVSCLGLLLILRQALRLHAVAAKAEALAAARSFEMEGVRGRATKLRHQVEGDAERLRQALRSAQTDAPATTVSAAGALSPLAEEIDVTVARLHALHRDREQRRQLERAVARLVRALERAWLGLQWEWPDSSGTKLDDVVALLRSPNPRETARAHLDDSSGLLPIPTLDAAHMPSSPPWAPPAPHPLAPLAEPEPLWSSGELRATYLDGAYRDGARPARQPVLPWDEWDDWRGWDPSQDE